jgi:hypothetical protein
VRHRLVLISCLAVTAVLCGCGTSNDDLTGIIVSPHDGAAVHGSGADTVQFKAVGVYQTQGMYQINFTQGLNDARWTTSDSANSTIDVQGLATCTGHTPAPAIVTACHRGTAGDTIRGGAFVACD